MNNAIRVTEEDQNDEKIILKLNTLEYIKMIDDFTNSKIKQSDITLTSDK